MTERITTKKNSNIDYLSPELIDSEVDKMSTLGLAHVGDAVYELLARTWLASHGRLTSRRLHNETVGIVRAPAQALAARVLLEELTEDESAVYRRGRNTRTNTIPKGAEANEYHAATGLEALFGWLYLRNRHERINELFGIIMEMEHAS